MKRLTEDMLITYTVDDERNALADAFDNPQRWVFSVEAIERRNAAIIEWERTREARYGQQEVA